VSRGAVSVTAHQHENQNLYYDGGIIAWVTNEQHRR
jgi:hypothetical protein